MEGQPEVAAVKPLTVTDKLVNVYAAPGELYENVRQTPPTHSSWVVPLTLVILVTILMTFIVQTNPSLTQQYKDIVQKQMEKVVEQGNITQEQADQQLESFGPGSTFFAIASLVGPILFWVARLFALALVFWLLGRSVMSARAPFMKVVEVVGLTYFISILAAIATTALMFVTDSITATPSLGLTVSPFDIENKVHLALAALNVFTIWVLVVISIGLAKLFQRDFLKVLVLVFALWVIWTVFSVLTGITFG